MILKIQKYLQKVPLQRVRLVSLMKYKAHTKNCQLRTRLSVCGFIVGFLVVPLPPGTLHHINVAQLQGQTLQQKFPCVVVVVQTS